MNAARAAAAHRKLAEAHIELAEALEENDAPPAPPKRAKPAARRRHGPPALTPPDNTSEMDVHRARQLARKHGIRLED